VFRTPSAMVIPVFLVDDDGNYNTSAIADMAASDGQIAV